MERSSTNSVLLIVILLALCLTGVANASPSQTFVKNGVTLQKDDYLSCTTKDIAEAQILQDYGSVDDQLDDLLGSEKYIQDRFCADSEKKFYMLDFVMANAVAFSLPKTLMTSFAVDKPLVVNGLRMMKKAGVTMDGPILTIQHNSPAPLIINGLEIAGVKNGLRIFRGRASGPVYIFDSKIEGDGQKLGDCIDVRARGTVIDATTAKFCDDGILVDANNVQIVNGSTIAGNHIGVRLVAGRENLVMSRALVFGNSDGDPQTVNRDDAFRVEGPEGYPDANDILYTDDDGNESIVLNDKIDDTTTIEFYRLSGGACMGGGIASMNQPCDFLEVPGLGGSVLRITPEMLYGGDLSLELPEEYWSTQFVIAYRTGSGSTSRYSRALNANDSGIVAIIQNPLDIPTPGNEEGGTSGGITGEPPTDPTTEPPDEEPGDGSGNRMSASGDTEGDAQLATGTGLASGCGHSGSSIVAVSSTTLFFQSLGILWILLVVAFLASLRAVYVKVNRKDRR